jgi:hypothetical protein
MRQRRRSGVVEIAVEKRNLGRCRRRRSGERIRSMSNRSAQCGVEARETRRRFRRIARRRFHQSARLAHIGSGWCRGACTKQSSEVPLPTARSRFPSKTYGSFQTTRSLRSCPAKWTFPRARSKATFRPSRRCCLFARLRVGVSRAFIIPNASRRNRHNRVMLETISEAGINQEQWRE